MLQQLAGEDQIYLARYRDICFLVLPSSFAARYSTFPSPLDHISTVHPLPVRIPVCTRLGANHIGFHSVP